MKKILVFMVLFSLVTVAAQAQKLKDKLDFLKGQVIA